MAQDPSPRRAGLLQCVGLLVGQWVLAHRGHPDAALALRGAAAIVFALTLASPRRLKAINHALGRALTTALLVAVYALALLPTRALLALLRVDPLAPRRAAGTSLWIERDTPSFTREDFERTS